MAHSNHEPRSFAPTSGPSPDARRFALEEMGVVFEELIECSWRVTGSSLDHATQQVDVVPVYMYPFESDAFAMRNQWYVASYSRDVSRKPLQRWILDEPVVLFRKQNGAVVALEGRCAHRHFPLAEGTLLGDTLQCRYHGLVYDSDGSAVRIPSQPAATSRCRIKSYPTIELWDWIWIWMGDRDRADPTLIPDHYDMGLTDPEFLTTIVCHHLLEARYQLVHDNLLDLSHVAFLHANTIGGGSEGTATSNYPRSSGPNWARSDRLLRKTILPPHYGRHMGASGECDRYMPIFFYMPSLHIGMDDFRRPSNSPDALGESLGKLLVYHAVTPARRNTTHYFAAAGRNFGRDADEEQMVAAFNAVIDEDVFGLQAIEQMVREMGDRLPPEFSTRADTQQVLIRRKLESLILSDGDGAVAEPPLRFQLKSLGDTLFAERRRESAGGG